MSGMARTVKRTIAGIVLLSSCAYAVPLRSDARPSATAPAHWAAPAHFGACRSATLSIDQAPPAMELVVERVRRDARGFPRSRKATRPATPRHPNELRFDELTFKLPPMEKVTLENGLTVILIQRPDLPVFAMDLAIKMCDAYMPQDKRGLTSVLASVWRSGGTVNRFSEQLDYLVETLGGTLEIAAMSEYVSIDLEFLSRDMETAVEIMADVLLRPSFPEDRLELVKSQKLDSIKRRHEDPAKLASLATDLVLYGSSHPYGRLVDPEALGAVTRRDLVELHSEFVRPNNAVLAVAGDFDREFLLELLRKHLASWKPQTVDFPPVPPQALPDPGVVTLVPSEAGDCFVRLVHAVQSKGLRDEPVEDVANVIMGYYRLVGRLRMQEGLAFNPYTWFELRDHGGGFGASFECAPSDLCRAIEVTLEVLQDFCAQGILEEELQHGKDFYLNLAPFAYDSVGEVAAMHSWLELRKRPMDHWMLRFEKLSALTVPVVQSMVGSHVHPDRLALVVVGPLSEIDCDLSKFGRLRQVAKLEELTSIGQ